MRQAFRVEGVRGIEIFEAGLVEIDDRHAFELEAVQRQQLRAKLANLRRIFAAALVHFLQRHLRRDRAHRRGELAFQQLAQPVRLHGALSQRLRGGGDQLTAGADAHEELADYIDANAVLGDQRHLLLAPHLDPHHVHVDWRDLVQNRDHEGAAVHHHLLAEKSGAHERDFLGRTPVQPLQDIDGDRDDDGDDDEPQEQVPKGLRGHDCDSSRRLGAQPKLTDLNLRVCSVNARSVGNRSIDEAP